MPPTKQWIDKKTSTKYQLFHRSQQDPLIHDPEAQDRFLHPVYGPPSAAPGNSSSRSAIRETRNLGALSKEFQGSGARENEGEAANHGIYFDDTKYDYMQHLRGIGEGGGESHFIESSSRTGTGKANKGVKLEDALRDISLEGDELDGSMYGDSSVGGDFLSTTSSYVRKPSYQHQQNVPDAIAGFQPDMDPRLREALEALEDDAFVDQEGDEDIFSSLVEGGQDAEVDPDEWRDTYLPEDEDGGWESDATEKAPVQVQHTDSSAISQPSTSNINYESQSLPPQDDQIPDSAEHEGDWLRNFAKYKKDIKTNKKEQPNADQTPSEFRTATSTAFTVGGTPIRKKKRKGAMTNPSAYSMTSSSLARTEGHRLLDDRFERVEALYALDEEGEDYADDMSMVSGMSRLSKYSFAPSAVSQADRDIPLRSDFDSVMDGFLTGWEDRGSHAKRKGAKGKRGKNGNEVMGMKMLDEVREGLGPPKLSQNTARKV
ncbi:hypothetical protein FQN57_005397 [Myotisia sp. PD_48]|nr:hypothetical protein FQN57_005397 [Myotisia sp. PD_48]